MRYAWFAALGVSLACISSAWAQKLPWEEYDRLAEMGRSIAPLKADDMFGDSVDLYSGGLSFSATDVSLPGNNALPVSVGRKLVIANRKDYPAFDYAFDNWDLDIPNISAVFSTQGNATWCTSNAPPIVTPGIDPDKYWNGHHANLPGGGELLLVNAERPQPATGGPFRWVTAGNTYFSCLTSIQNGTGEGFLAITADGTKYWFNHMAQYGEPSYKHVYGYSTTTGNNVYILSRKKYVLYVTRVEDRFGNWVTYTYNNVSTAPVKLTSITSSDGRSLTLQYNASNFVSSITDGARTWTYQYSGSNLSQVLLPDASTWTYSLGSLSSLSMQYATEDTSRKCTYPPEFPIPGDASGSITHPSGAVATFVAGPRITGVSNVPLFCINWQPKGTPGNDENDDYPVFPFQWVTVQIVSKQIQGPGLSTQQWDYEFGGDSSWGYAPGTTEPVCHTATCAEPYCTSDACAGTRTAKITNPDGSWKRHVFGNSYRYNEGKLLAIEVAGSDGEVLKTTVNTYNYATSGQPYAPRIGTSPQPRGLGFVDEYPRPLVKTETSQDGGLFVWEVAKGCTTAGVYCLDSLIRPTKVTKTGTVAAITTGSTTTTAAPTQTPTLTAPGTNATGSYTVSWTGAPLATEYELQERLASGSWSTIQNTGATSRVLSGKAAGSWGYQVRACNGAGCTAWSATQTTVVTLPPTSAPTLTTPTTNTTGSYTASWTSVSAATRYELEQRKDAGSWSNIYNSTGTSIALTGQVAGSYDHRVRACNTGGCSDWSAYATTTVIASTLGTPSLTVSPTVASQGETLYVSWTSVSGATQYTLERSRNGGSYTSVYSGTATSTSLVTGATGVWSYRVKACNTNGCGSYSGAIEVSVTSGGGSQNALIGSTPNASILGGG
ncbi:MAG: hypothetical protein QM599_11650 [Pseudoxanthomonas sp.]